MTEIMLPCLHADGAIIIECLCVAYTLGECRVLVAISFPLNNNFTIFLSLHFPFFQLINGFSKWK